MAGAHLASTCSPVQLLAWNSALSRFIILFVSGTVSLLYKIYCAAPCKETPVSLSFRCVALSLHYDLLNKTASLKVILHILDFLLKKFQKMTSYFYLLPLPKQCTTTMNRERFPDRR